MQELPSEIIWQICTLVPVKMHRNLLETSKMFQNICFEAMIHEINVKQERVQEFLERFPKTLAYIKRIKPNLKRIFIQFDWIKNAPTWKASTFWQKGYPKIPVKNLGCSIWLHFNRCPMRVVKDLIQWFEPGFKCSIDRWNDIDEDEFAVYDQLEHLQMTRTYFNEQQHLTQFLQHPRVMEANTIYLGYYNMADRETILTADLRDIDVTKNEKLVVTLTEGRDLVCVDTHKVTDLEIYLADTIQVGLVCMELSLSNDEIIQAGQGRMKHVIIYSRTGNGASEYAIKRLLEIMRALLPCKDIEYYIQLQHPRMVYVIHKMLEMGISKNKIILACDSSRLLKITKYCMCVYASLRDMKILTLDEVKDEYKNMTIEELYQSISDTDRIKWACVHYARQLCA